MSERARKEDTDLEAAVESVGWRVERLERTVGRYGDTDGEEAGVEGEDPQQSVMALADECKELQKRLVENTPELEEFWRLHNDFEAALQAPGAAAVREALESAETSVGTVGADGSDAAGDALRRELEEMLWRAEGPDESSAVYNAPEYRERLERVAARAREQERAAAALRARVLELVRATARFTQDASAQLLALDALVPELSSDSSL